MICQDAVSTYYTGSEYKISFGTENVTYCTSVKFKASIETDFAWKKLCIANSINFLPKLFTKQHFILIIDKILK